ncbi:hypothetical protein [Parvibaculum sp.]|uniref:hypothetical protein n=1 Tax=Parvibaculum sp. TaxID=2024848 RepID=UPI001DF7F87F|nr:hypothetical protein [Parvibaculum sp.]MBX3488901.1 hypothetical protein [Parvibaculum sp.]MCW5727217.1 hypothetical protein [Parvibaculum sp.]
MKKFQHELGEAVTLISGEAGKVIARAEYLEATPSYYIRYVTAQGELTERWWGAEAIGPNDAAPVAGAGAAGA